MLFRVAALLGRTVEEVLGTMSADEFDGWCTLYALEPWGWHADNWRMSVTAATVANYSGRVKKRVKPSDFLPKPPGKKRQKMSAEELKMRLQADVEKAKRDDT